MAPRYRRVAVIGAGPAGLAATHALAAENAFDTIRVFERCNRVGGSWHYDPEPDVFPATTGVPTQQTKTPPAKIPSFAPPAPPDPRARSPMYWDMDSNVGAEVMAFTHTPFPVVNSPLSIERFGHNNPSRPYGVIVDYLEDLFQPYRSFVSLSTAVEKAEKLSNGQWVLTLRKSGELYRGKVHDYWWTETFDAVIVASGHYSVPLLPSIPNLIETSKQFPGQLEHSKSYRKAAKYANKRTMVVGGNVSAADIIQDLQVVVKGPLEVALRGRNPDLDAVYHLPNVRLHPTVQSISPGADGRTLDVVFADGARVNGLDHIIFATGYRLQYPFLNPNPTTPENRVAGFYQHVFNMKDPSLTLVGQVKEGISFRVYEYQSVAIARLYAGRNAVPLPPIEHQLQWEQDRLRRLGPSYEFHAIYPDFAPYYNWLSDFAGPPAPGTDAYALPRWRDEWADKALAVVRLKNKYWRNLTARESVIRAKL